MSAQGNYAKDDASINRQGKSASRGKSVTHGFAGKDASFRAGEGKVVTAATAAHSS